MICDMLKKCMCLLIPPLIHANRLTTWPRLLYMLMGGCVDGSLPLLVVALLALLGLPHLAFCALRGNGFGGVDATAHGHVVRTALIVIRILIIRRRARETYIEVETREPDGGHARDPNPTGPVLRTTRPHGTRRLHTRRVTHEISLSHETCVVIGIKESAESES